MEKPVIFIGSSSRSAETAGALRSQLQTLLGKKKIEVKCWNDPNMFTPGSTTIQGLIEWLQDSHMGVFIFNDDDFLLNGDSKTSVTRDNVIFEYGLFAGKLGPKRAFIVKPSGLPDFKMPSDLLGITYLSFDPPKNGLTKAQRRKQLTTKLKKPAEAIAFQIDTWRKEVSRVKTEEKKKENKFFSGFYDHYEPKLLGDQRIGYSRCLNLLLYMFTQESFKEFRAVDLAFSRWHEVREKNTDKKKKN
jgi:predicted nucleotide-binding protein